MRYQFMNYQFIEMGSIIKDRDALLYLSTFFKPNEAVNLAKTNVNIHKVIEHVPYKDYKLEWNSSYTEIKNIMKYNNAVYHLTLNHFEFIDKMFIALPKLQQLTIVNCELDNLCLIYFYVSTLRILIIDNCKIGNTEINLDKFKCLNIIKVNGNEINVKKLKGNIKLGKYKYSYECDTQRDNMDCD